MTTSPATSASPPPLPRLGALPPSTVELPSSSTSFFHRPWVRVAGMTLGGAAVGGLAGLALGGPGGALTGALVGGGVTFATMVAGIAVAMRRLT